MKKHIIFKQKHRKKLKKYFSFLVRYENFDQNVNHDIENMKNNKSKLPIDEFDSTTIRDLDRWEKEKFSKKIENKTVPTGSSFFSAHEHAKKNTHLNRKHLSIGTLVPEKFLNPQ
jgi:hypothetical protein